MGLLDWVKKSRGEGRLRKAASSHPHAPCFEQLEPRVLLSADCLMPLESPLHDTPFESAIVVELDEASGQSDCVTVGGLEGEKVIEGGVEDKKVGREEERIEAGGTVEQFDSLTVGQSDSATVDRSEGEKVGSEEDKTDDGETVERCDGLTGGQFDSQADAPSQALTGLQLSASAELLATQQNENQPSIADASEDLEFQPSDFTLHTSHFGFGQCPNPRPSGRYSRELNCIKRSSLRSIRRNRGYV